MGRIKRKIKELFFEIISLPKSLYVCLRLLPFYQAIRIPILVRYNTRLYDLSGKVELNAPVKFAMVCMGFSFNGIFDARKEQCSLQILGTMRLGRQVLLGVGSRLVVGKDGVLTIGNHFDNSAKLYVICEQKVTIGHDVVCSWDVLIMDTDYHETKDLRTGKISSERDCVIIGDRVWLCGRSMVLKGSDIPEGCILGAMSIANKPYATANALLVGQPAKIKREDITIHRKYENN